MNPNPSLDSSKTILEIWTFVSEFLSRISFGRILSKYSKINNPSNDLNRRSSHHCESLFYLPIMLDSFFLSLLGPLLPSIPAHLSLSLSLKVLTYQPTYPLNPFIHEIQSNSLFEVQLANCCPSLTLHISLSSDIRLEFKSHLKCLSNSFK